MSGDGLPKLRNEIKSAWSIELSTPLYTTTTFHSNRNKNEGVIAHFQKLRKSPREVLGQIGS